MSSVRSVAVAVTHDDPPQVMIAENDDVVSRLIAIELVAKTAPSVIGSAEQLAQIRSALLEERWADAVVEWMTATDSIVDVYPDEPVWAEADLDAERTALEIRMSPIFRD